MFHTFRYNLIKHACRYYADCVTTKTGLVLGAYEGCSGEMKLTPTGVIVDHETSGKLSELIKGTLIKKGKAQVYHNLLSGIDEIAVAGLGHEGVGLNETQSLDECKENIRIAAGVGARTLQDRGVTNIKVESFTNAESAAEGAILAVWKYSELRNKQFREHNPVVDLYNEEEREDWTRGQIKAESQNIARKLEQTPGNIMTPSIFAQSALEILCPCGIQVAVRDLEWIQREGMTAFLSIARSSCQVPIFLELAYCGTVLEEKPLVFIGKGITFDTGGMCLKSCEGMSEAGKGDLAGAAVIIGLFRAVAQMSLPINLIGLIPLCENMTSGMAMKPGDVVLALNGKTIRIDDTDNEGRIIMADALTYATKFRPCLVISVANLAYALRKGLGTFPNVAFSTSNTVWSELNRAGMETGDRVWRFPLWKHFFSKVTGYPGVDVNNVGLGKGGDPCLAAAFLMEFTPPNVDFLHVDISGTGLHATGVGHPYLRKNSMTGRPVRTLAQFVYQIACPHNKDQCDC